MIFSTCGTFDINVDGLLSVTAKENESGKEQSVTIQGSSNLSENEIEKITIINRMSKISFSIVCCPQNLLLSNWTMYRDSTSLFEDILHINSFICILNDFILQCPSTLFHFNWVANKFVD